MRVPDRARQLFDRVLKFLRAYVSYVRQLNLRKLFEDWGRGFLEEILESRVSQVSLIFAVMGITGFAIGGLRLAFSHLALTLTIMAVGVVAIVAVSMFAFNIKQQLSNADDTASHHDLDALLALLLERGPLPKARIREELELAADRIEALFHQANTEGWIAIESGAIKVSESMKPIARTRVRLHQK